MKAGAFFFILIISMLTLTWWWSDTRTPTIDAGDYYLTISSPTTRIPANSVATARIDIQAVTAGGEKLPATDIQVYIQDGLDSGRIVYTAPSADGLTAILQSTFRPGVVRIVAEAPDSTQAALEIQVEMDMTDSDDDGFPDVVELTDPNDRTNFRSWFVAIAEAQFEQPGPTWHPEQQDCAGLLRYAFREALKPHDADWFRTQPGLELLALPDVQKYQYPDVPLLGQQIFRTSDAPLTNPAAIDSIFKNFVETRYLIHYNCSFLGKDRESARSGDLVFFFHFDDPGMPYHSMVFIRDENDPQYDRFIYHTGPADDGSGEMRRVKRQTLDQHPDDRWRPVASNPYFLGYFRWKILN